jgi:pimeloyl-ACP methyl ester carboxylesterase
LKYYAIRPGLGLAVGTRVRSTILVAALALSVACEPPALVPSTPEDAAPVADDGAPSPPPDDAGEKADGPTTPPPPITTPAKTLRLTLDHGAFPSVAGRPDAVVYVPANFRQAPPVDVVVFLHGFYNCADNVIRSTNSTCTPGSPARQAYALADQLERSNKNALLVVPELAFDRASSDAGRFAEDNGFLDFIEELLGKIPEVGDYTLADLGRVVVLSHSGGWRAAAGIARKGGVSVDELALLDSLYGAAPDFDAWILEDTAALVTRARRYVNVYTSSTQAAAQAQATRLKPQLPAGVVLDDRTTATLTTAQYDKGAIWKRTGLTHDGHVRYYVERILSTSGLSAR